MVAAVGLCGSGHRNLPYRQKSSVLHPWQCMHRGVCNSRCPNSPLISFRWLRFVAGRRPGWVLGPLRSSSPCRPSTLTEARHALALSPGSAIGPDAHRAAAATTCTSTVYSDILRVNNRPGETSLTARTVDISEDAWGPLKDAWAHGSWIDGTLRVACASCLRGMATEVKRLQPAAGDEWAAPSPEATRPRHEARTIRTNPGRSKSTGHNQTQPAPGREDTEQPRLARGALGRRCSRNWLAGL